MDNRARQLIIAPTAAQTLTAAQRQSRLNLAENLRQFLAPCTARQLAVVMPTTTLLDIIETLEA
jgi:hypothetical protein